MAIRTISYDHEKVFHIYLYDYLLKNKKDRTAEIFREEANMSDFSLHHDTPQGFLHVWWSSFHDEISNHDKEAILQGLLQWRMAKQQSSQSIVGNHQITPDHPRRSMAEQQRSHSIVRNNQQIMPDHERRRSMAEQELIIRSHSIVMNHQIIPKQVAEQQSSHSIVRNQQIISDEQRRMAEQRSSHSIVRSQQVMTEQSPNGNGFENNLGLPTSSVENFYDSSNHMNQPVVDSNHGLSQPVVDSNHGLSRPVVDSNHGLSQPVVDSNHGLSRPVVDSNHGLSQPVVDSNHGLMSQPAMDFNHGFSQLAGDLDYGFTQLSREFDCRFCQPAKEFDYGLSQLDINDINHSLRQQKYQKETIQRNGNNLETIAAPNSVPLNGTSHVSGGPHFHAGMSQGSNLVHAMENEETEQQRSHAKFGQPSIYFNLIRTLFFDYVNLVFNKIHH
ncbi:uncharacterized protein LOC133800412 [Humulus lupulus]|uniref:uncharacterized protein LOC133800412 n=1 Tax=Humulus lupulus TaxID=3486 RepID=UPI002B409975|nr:uncharacterized protein LOC133800412 [Humulus lupulus]